MSSLSQHTTLSLICVRVVQQKTLQKVIKDSSLYLRLMHPLSQEKMFGLFLTEDLCLLNLIQPSFSDNILHQIGIASNIERNLYSIRSINGGGRAWDSNG